MEERRGDESGSHFHRSVDLRGRGREKEKRSIRLHSDLYSVLYLLVRLHGLFRRVKPSVHMRVKQKLPQFPAEQNMETQLSVWAAFQMNFQGCFRLCKECRLIPPLTVKRPVGSLVGVTTSCPWRLCYDRAFCPPLCLHKALLGLKSLLGLFYI